MYKIEMSQEVVDYEARKVAYDKTESGTRPPSPMTWKVSFRVESEDTVVIAAALRGLANKLDPPKPITRDY